MNTKEGQPDSTRAEVIDRYGIKLLSSGYSKDQTKKIVVNGIKGYLRKRERRKTAGRGHRIHLTSEESHATRMKKKMLGKSSWYRNKRSDKDDSKYPGQRQGRGPREGRKMDNLKTRAVMFVEQTPMGELARRVKEQLQGLETTLGFKIKVVERTGKSLQSVFSQTQAWQGLQCGRTARVTCYQGGEELPPCTLANVVYESMCRTCNPSCTKKGELESQESGHPSLYVGRHPDLSRREPQNIGRPLGEETQRAT